ncbi:MAG: LptF/LptG family permease [Planctomycetaceae bacterium]|nr:LptF/LptG family permease [Planctomycetaceae bacterium]MCB9950465.1 LptF/LptG family permease [Planctomycetaceae bacterium]
MFRIPLLQRYIFWEVLRAFVFVLACITVLLMFVGVFQQATERGMGAEQILRVLPYLVPSMLPFTIPAALLLTISVVYGRLAGDSEFTAAKAAGIHPISLMGPAFLFGFFLSAAAYLLTDQVIPWSVRKIEQQFMAVMEDILIEQLRTELQFTDPGHRFHVTVARVEGRTLVHPVIRYVKGNGVVTVKAESADIRLDTEQQYAIVKLHNPYSDLAEHGRIVMNRDFELPIRWSSRKNAPPARNFPISEIEEEMDGIQLAERMQRERQVMQALMALSVADFPRLTDPEIMGAHGMEQMVSRREKLNTEIHSRYALACSCFFFAMLGTPFAIMFGKNQFLTSFLFCFVPIVGGYYPLMLGLMTQAKEGHIGPEWSMWIANGLLLVSSWFVLRRVIRY